jgi:hypothetical protein
MRIKANVPLRVAIEGIKFTKSQPLPLIRPSEAAVLKVDFTELTSLQSGPKTVDTASVDVPSTLISSPSNLVEVTEHQPTDPRRWLLRN